MDDANKCYIPDSPAIRERLLCIPMAISNLNFNIATDVDIHPIMSKTPLNCGYYTLHMVMHIRMSCTDVETTFETNTYC